MTVKRILARSFGNVSRTFWLVSVSGKTAYITDDKGFNEIQDTGWTDSKTAFLIDNIFVYDETVKHGSRPDWSRLTPLRASLAAGGGDA